jgi:HEAT repeat protein
MDEQATTLDAEPAVRAEPITVLSGIPSATPTLEFKRPDPDLVRRVETITISARPEPQPPAAFRPTPRPRPPDTSALIADPQPATVESPPLVDADADTAPMEVLETPPAPPAADATAETEPLPAVSDTTARSVMVEMTEEIDRLVERVLARGAFDQAAAELLVGIGDDALQKLVAHFPGPLNCDRYQDLSRLRKVDQHGSLLKTLIMFGDRAVPYVVPLLDSLDSEVRFYATFLFSEIRHPDALGALIHRIFDNDRQIRAVTMDVLRKFSDFPEYGWAMKELAETLAAPSTTLENKRIAAEALGELREPRAVKALAEMLGSVDGILAERCHRSLIKTTFNDFGFSERRWLSWWHTNSGRHRIEWAIDSLTHRVEDIRRSAAEELRRMVKGAIDWPSGPMDHKQRKDLRRRLEDWWKREGRALYPVAELD